MSQIPLKKVSNILNPVNRSPLSQYPDWVKMNLVRAEICGERGNFISERELNESEIYALALLCSSADGNLASYKQWYDEATESWRIVYGYYQKED